MLSVILIFIFCCFPTDTEANIGHTSMDQINQGFTMNSTNPSRVSPPKSTIDSTPLQPAMDKNKECKYILLFTLSVHQINIHLSIFLLFSALKVKLLVRRSLNQLVEQGIMPCRIKKKR